MELERKQVSQDVLCQLQNDQDKEIENGTHLKQHYTVCGLSSSKAADIWNKMLTSSTLMILLILWKTRGIDCIHHMLSQYHYMSTDLGSSWAIKEALF